ncbi:MAG: hypothetical protein WCJ25_03495 [Candidatus Moraniibacteriota bacterium]
MKIEATFDSLTQNDINPFLHIKTDLQSQGVITLLTRDYYSKRFSFEHIDNPSPFPFFHQAATMSPFDCFGYIQAYSPHVDRITEMLASVRDSGMPHLTYLKNGVQERFFVQNRTCEKKHSFVKILNESDIVLSNYVTIKRLANLGAIPESQEMTLRQLIQNRPYR